MKGVCFVVVVDSLISLQAVRETWVIWPLAGLPLHFEQSKEPLFYGQLFAMLLVINERNLHIEVSRFKLPRVAHRKPYFVALYSAPGSCIL